MPNTAEFTDFRALSARLGADPLQVQGPGGNTSLKDGGTMWIKASGTELAAALKKDIFVAVSHAAAMAEARGETGDGSCKATVLDPAGILRPSIETSFHAILPWRVVAHTHSIATLAHAVSAHGRTAAMAKLVHLPAVLVPYAKPGLPLTQGIMARMTADTRVFILENHGLICCGNSVDETADLLAQVEACLALPARKALATPTQTAPPAGYVWAREGWIAQNPAVCALAVAGSYYPDHVVFLGPALPVRDTAQNPPAVVFPGTGIARRIDASASQRAMLRCLSDLLSRLPADWSPLPIGAQAEAELLNWDAEKYRQALAARA